MCEVFKETEKRYSTTNITSEDLVEVESILKQHFHEKDEFQKLINFTLGEGEEIVNRMRQQVNYFKNEFESS